MNVTAKSDFVFKDQPSYVCSVEAKDVWPVDKSIELLGMPLEEDWILSGPYPDKSFIRDALAYEMTRVGTCRYASRYKFIEFFMVQSGSSTLNYNDHYLGVYVVFEKLKRDGDRIDIDSFLNPEPVPWVNTGGYIVKIDRACATNCVESYYSGPAFTATAVIDYPRPTNANQLKYITDKINLAYQVLTSSYYADPNTGYAKYIDVGTWVDYFIMNKVGSCCCRRNILPVYLKVKLFFI